MRPLLPGLRRAAAALVCAVLLLCAGASALAQTHGEVVQLQLRRDAHGLYLDAALQLQLPDLVKDALAKGIAMHFIADAQVVHKRWYWSDKVLAHATRHLRLSYQPLTRRWRLMQSTQPLPAGGLGMALGQGFDDLSEAVDAMQRIARWKIADADELDGAQDGEVRFQFSLDMSQLPRLMHISAVGRSRWNVQLAQVQPLPPLAEPAPLSQDGLAGEPAAPTAEELPVQGEAQP